MLSIIIFLALFMFLILFVLSIIFMCISGDKYADLHIEKKNKSIDPTLSAVHHDDNFV